MPPTSSAKTTKGSRATTRSSAVGSDVHPALKQLDPYTEFLYKPHTISCLLLGALITPPQHAARCPQALLRSSTLAGHSTQSRALPTPSSPRSSPASTPRQASGPLCSPSWVCVHRHCLKSAALMVAQGTACSRGHARHSSARTLRYGNWCTASCSCT